MSNTHGLFAARTSLVAGASLPLGFAVGQWTGVRTLGGLLLLATLSWCWFQWRATAGARIAAGLSAAYAAAFLAAHLIAPMTGAIGAVLLVGCSFGLLVHASADRRGIGEDRMQRDYSGGL